MDLETRHRIGRARLLRRLGKTYDEIRAVVGPVRDETLARWLSGIPRPPTTYRGRAMTHVRRECRRLRRSGLTYDEIRVRTGVSKGTLSLWLRDLPVPDRCILRRKQQLARIAGSGPAAQRLRAQFRREMRISIAEDAMSRLERRELFLAGLALYWAEGTKDKPWNRNGRVVIINSDPSVLSVFLAWLDLVGVSSDRRSYRLSIHESAQVAEQERWWAVTLQIPLSSFRRASLKRHNPLPSRHNVIEGYHGCLTVSVARSRALYGRH
jgi:transcriptional regulator with XRE-family HTH domain